MIRSIGRPLSWFAVFACVVCAPLSFGQTNGEPYSIISIDYTHQDEPFIFSTFQMNNSYLRAYTYLNGLEYSSSTNCVPVFSYKLSDSSKYYTPVTGTVVGTYLLFNFTPAHLAVYGKDFPAIVTVTDTNLNKTWDFMNGRINVKQSYINGGLASLIMRGSVNWDTINNLGTVPWQINSSYTGDVRQAWVLSTLVAKTNGGGWEVGSHSGLATGTPVYAETDPKWSGVSNLYPLTTWITLQGYATNTDQRIADGSTAFGWGDHALAGYYSGIIPDGVLNGAGGVIETWSSPEGYIFSSGGVLRGTNGFEGTQIILQFGVTNSTFSLGEYQTTNTLDIVTFDGSIRWTNSITLPKP